MATTKECKEFLGEVTKVHSRYWKRVSKITKGRMIVREFQDTVLHRSITVFEDADGNLSTDMSNEVIVPRYRVFL